MKFLILMLTVIGVAIAYQPVVEMLEGIQETDEKDKTEMDYSYPFAFQRNEQIQRAADGSITITFLSKIVMPSGKQRDKKQEKDHGKDNKCKERNHDQDDADHPTQEPRVEYFPIDCTDLKNHSTDSRSGVYNIYPERGGEHLVYCDMDTDGGGWTVIQRRFNGTENFPDKLWSDYRDGFGNVAGEYWLGNEINHNITSQGEYELRFDLENFNNETRFAVYSDFKISNEDDGYRLSYGAYIDGDAGDSLYMAQGMKFTTKDRDQDTLRSENCAAVSRHPGAWWHQACFRTSLNAVYNDPPTLSTKWRGIIWNSWTGAYYSLKGTKMMIRRVGF